MDIANSSQQTYSMNEHVIHHRHSGDDQNNHGTKFEKTISSKS